MTAITMRPAVAITLLAALALLGACARGDQAASTATAEAPAPTATAPASVAVPATPTDPRAAMRALAARFATLKSYHVDMTTATPQGEMAVQMDFVAPDRYRMVMPMGTQVIVGDRMTMTMQGRTMQVPVPSEQLARQRDPANLESGLAAAEVEALGDEALDGVAARKYRLRNPGPPPSTSTLWIGTDGLPLRIDVDGGADAASRVTLRYSRFDDPTIRIDPPQ